MAIARRLLEEDSLELFVQPAFRDRSMVRCVGRASGLAACGDACMHGLVARAPLQAVLLRPGMHVAAGAPHPPYIRTIHLPPLQANSLALYVTSKSKRATEGLIQNVRRS